MWSHVVHYESGVKGGGGGRRGASMSLLAEFSYLMLYTTFHAFFNLSWVPGARAANVSYKRQPESFYLNKLTLQDLKAVGISKYFITILLECIYYFFCKNISR